MITVEGKKGLHISKNGKQMDIKKKYHDIQ